MMLSASSLPRVSAFASGLVCAAAFVFSGSLPAPDGHVAAAGLTATTGRTAELVLSPAGQLLATSDLRPDPRAAGQRRAIRVWNPTDVALSVALRARPSRGDLDRLILVRVEDGPRRLFEGTLADLSAGTPPLLELDAGGRKRLEIGAWRADSASPGFTGGSVDMTVDFETTVLGG